MTYENAIWRLRTDSLEDERNIAIKLYACEIGRWPRYLKCNIAIKQYAFEIGRWPRYLECNIAIKL